MLEPAGEGGLGARARATGERGGGGAGDPPIRVAQGDGEHVHGAVPRGEPEEERRAAADHGAVVADRGGEPVERAPVPHGRERLERGDAHGGAAIGELAIREVRRERLLEPGERAEERGLHLRLGLARERGGEQRRGGARPERLEGADRAEPAARVGGREVGHRALVERAIRPRPEEIPEPRPVSRADPHAPLRVEPAAELGDARGGRDGLPLARGPLRTPEPCRDGGVPEDPERLDLGAQLGDEPGEIRLAVLRRGLAGRPGGAVEPRPIDQPAEEPLALGLEQPDPVVELGGAPLDLGALRLLGRERLLELHFPPAHAARVSARAVRRGPGRGELGLELGHPALEEDDLLERAPEEALRLVVVLRAARPAVHSRPPARRPWRSRLIMGSCGDIGDYDTGIREANI